MTHLGYRLLGKEKTFSELDQKHFQARINLYLVEYAANIHVDLRILNNMSHFLIAFNNAQYRFFLIIEIQNLKY